MSRHLYLITAALAFAAGCTDKPKPAAGDEGSAEPAAEAVKAVALPPLTPLGKPGAELEAEGWTAAEVPPELAARLRDSTPAAPEPGSPALERELRAMARPQNAPAFESGFADTVRLIERALYRLAAARHDEREAEIVDSLKRAMEPRDPDLDAVSAATKLLQPALPEHPNRAMPLHLASFREELPSWGTVMSPARPVQQSQTRTIQIAPGIQGTETTTSDGSTSSTEVSFKRGPLESTAKQTTTSAQEYEKRGEIGSKVEIGTTKRSKGEGSAGEEIDRSGWEERLSYCPDAGGLVRGRFTRSVHTSKVMTVGTVTINYAFDLRGDYELTVSADDNARAQEVLVAGTSILKIAIGARGGGNARPTLKELRADSRWQTSVHEPGTYKDGKATLQGSMHYRLSSADAADRSFDDALMENTGHAMGAATSLAKKAEQRWRNGACIEVTPHPEEKALRFGGKTRFRIDVKHKRDSDGSFPYPVRMMAKREYSFIDRTLGKLDPDGTLTAPASFQYTAPAKGSPEAQTWRNSSTPDHGYPMSISRRGIGLTNFYVPYDSLRRAFYVTYHRARDTQKHGMAQEVTFRAVLHELDQPDDNDDTFAGTGDYSIVERLWEANCASYGPKQTEVVRGGGTIRAKGSISGEEGATTTLIFNLEPLSGPKMRLFTKSFYPLEQQLRNTAGKGNDDEVPFMAGRAVGMVEVRGKAGEVRRAVVTGESECEGEMTTKTLVQVKRLR